MAKMRPDPSATVDEPVRRGLEMVMTRGVAAFAVGLLAVLVTAISAEGPIHEFAHFALPMLLVAVVVARIVHVALTRDAPDGDGVWQRAHAIARTETQLAGAAAVAVPVMWAIGGGAILVRHAGHDLGVIVGFWIPFGVVVWGAASVAWLDDCRERLALALRESDRRFRTYWRNPGRAV